MAEFTSSVRTCRVRVQITDDAGAVAYYDLVPATPPEALSGYRLYKHDGRTVYTLALTADGQTSCTCKGFRLHPQHAPCKHLGALAAIGLLNAGEYLRLRGRELELDARAADLERQRELLAKDDRRPLPPPRPRRPRRRPLEAA